MTLKVSVKGMDRLARKLQRLQRDQRRALAEAVEESAEELRDELKDVLGREGAGASAPGTPPQSDTGRLADSLFVEIDADGLGARVGSDLDYAAHLEFGTTKMAARPWLQPTFERMKPKIVRRLAKAAKAGLRKTARG